MELNKFRFELVATKSLYKITEKFVSNAKYLQTEVLNIENLPKHISVNTKKGRYYARKIVDSRNIFQADCLYMTDKVSVESNSNYDCVVFIDGLKTNGQGVCFEYRLPLKKRQEIHVVNISRHRPVEKVKFLILQNQLIMNPKDSRIINIGSRAGWVKSTTGYGIPAMLREIPRVAVSIKNDTNYFFKRAAFYDLCDRYLYDLFRNDPQRAVEFLNRFLCLNSEAILSFLDESANISQIVQLVKVMSKSHNRLN